MNFNFLKISLAALGAGILPGICSATCSTSAADCFPIPAFSSFLTSWGDWIAGIFTFMSTPMFFGIAIWVGAGVIAFILYLVGKAVATLMGH